MKISTMRSRLVVALLICGTLDILYASGSTVLRGGNVAGMLRGVASGPFGDAVREMGLAGSALGLGVHFAIMAVMVTGFALAAQTGWFRKLPWWLLGLAYGGLLYLVMYRLVLPMRWPTLHPLHDMAAIGWSLLPHLVCVGLPTAWIFRQGRDTV